MNNRIEVTKNDDGSYSLACNHYGMMDGGEFSASLTAQGTKELPAKIEELFKMHEDAMPKSKKKGPKNVTVGIHLGMDKKGKMEESEDEESED